ncbi:hypothetical protein J6W78_08780 [bacterium]|nr:hypothetical protein [bacterium]
MSDFPCFDSEISAAGLKFSIHTEVVPSGAVFKINTLVLSSDGVVFSFNTLPGENFSEDDVRARHEKIAGKVPSIFSVKTNSAGGNNVDFAALYMKKEFRSVADDKNKMLEKIRKTLVCENE